MSSENQQTTSSSLLPPTQQPQPTENKSWFRLNKTAKLVILNQYAERYSTDKHDLGETDVDVLKQFFKDCLDKDKLKTSKEVVFDASTQTITSIPSLHYVVDKTADSKRFTLKNSNRMSTLKHLHVPRHA